MGSQDERDTDHWYWGYELDKLKIVSELGVAPVAIKIQARGEDSTGETRWFDLPDDVWTRIERILRGQE